MGATTLVREFYTVLRTANNWNLVSASTSFARPAVCVKRKTHRVNAPEQQFTAPTSKCLDPVSSHPYLSTGLTPYNILLDSSSNPPPLPMCSPNQRALEIKRLKKQNQDLARTRENNARVQGKNASAHEKALAERKTKQYQDLQVNWRRNGLLDPDTIQIYRGHCRNCQSASFLYRKIATLKACLPWFVKTPWLGLVVLVKARAERSC